MIIAKPAFILKNRIFPFLFQPRTHIPIVSFLRVFSSQTYMSNILAVYFYLYPNLMQGILVRRLPDLSRLRFLACHLFPLRWLRGRQVSRERSYGQFGVAFFLHPDRCRPILSFLWHDDFVAEVSNELTKKNITVHSIIRDRRCIDTRRQQQVVC